MVLVIQTVPEFGLLHAADSLYSFFLKICRDILMKDMPVFIEKDTLKV